MTVGCATICLCLSCQPCILCGKTRIAAHHFAVTTSQHTSDPCALTSPTGLAHGECQCTLQIWIILIAHATNSCKSGCCSGLLVLALQVLLVCIGMKPASSRVLCEAGDRSILNMSHMRMIQGLRNKHVWCSTNCTCSICAGPRCNECKECVNHTADTGQHFQAT